MDGVVKHKTTHNTSSYVFMKTFVAENTNLRKSPSVLPLQIKVLMKLNNY